MPTKPELEIDLFNARSVLKQQDTKISILTKENLAYEAQAQSHNSEIKALEEANQSLMAQLETAQGKFLKLDAENDELILANSEIGKECMKHLDQHRVDRHSIVVLEGALRTITNLLENGYEH